MSDSVGQWDCECCGGGGDARTRVLQRVVVLVSHAADCEALEFLPEQPEAEAEGDRR